WKLTMLLRNKGEQEVVSNEKKDRRDFLQLETLATRMGLYSRQYARVVVFSKVPLPNYRPDLDDKRPLREVLLCIKGDFVVVTGGSDGVDDSSGGDRGEDWSKWLWKSVKYAC
ncbi:ATP-dependent RNA helicase DHX36-like, partial [Trifolium medium]|nr:ATP-dependent RNA helicase DHX36-like [Trifolium medium]